MAEEKKIPEETKAAVPITDASEVRGIPKTIFIVLTVVTTFIGRC